jgi:hypothetical protein
MSGWVGWNMNFVASRRALTLSSSTTPTSRRRSLVEGQQNRGSWSYLSWRFWRATAYQSRQRPNLLNRNNSSVPRRSKKDGGGSRF